MSGSFPIEHLEEKAKNFISNKTAKHVDYFITTNIIFYNDLSFSLWDTIGLDVHNTAFWGAIHVKFREDFSINDNLIYEFSQNSTNFLKRIDDIIFLYDIFELCYENNCSTILFHKEDFSKDFFSKQNIGKLFDHLIEKNYRMVVIGDFNDIKNEETNRLLFTKTLEEAIKIL